ncbi:CurL C-terminal domain-containing protein, partial [Saccharothrix sp. NRRL B-16314]|uniref:CurL C-terminal domain-containing protein n=1 Tax=Saccharothrix sp. NRRL B-16314 TaxID=1463825 RepID=UPI003FA78402
MIVEQAPVVSVGSVRPGVRGVVSDVVVWVVSARSESGLVGQARRLAGWVAARPGLSPVDVGWSLSRRARLEYRAVVVGSGRDELLAGLVAVADGRVGVGRPGEGVVVGRVTGA